MTSATPRPQDKREGGRAEENSSSCVAYALYTHKCMRVCVCVDLITTYVLSKNKNQKKKERLTNFSVSWSHWPIFIIAHKLYAFQFAVIVASQAFNLPQLNEALNWKRVAASGELWNPPPCLYNLLIIFGKLCCKSRNCSIKMMCEATHTHTHMQTQLTNFHVQSARTEVDLWYKWKESHDIR